mmetsp:Transcript_2901/g.10586  ORF Transcript_2901/g.10586 Transcript_2901/m.10586 type:complete len:174 (+) Transcript_2901:254-775(+)
MEIILLRAHANQVACAALPGKDPAKAAALHAAAAAEQQKAADREAEAEVADAQAAARREAAAESEAWRLIALWGGIKLDAELPAAGPGSSLEVRLAANLASGAELPRSLAPRALRGARRRRRRARGCDCSGRRGASWAEAMAGDLLAVDDSNDAAMLRITLDYLESCEEEEKE